MAGIVSYRPSGKVGPAAVVFGLLLGGAAAVALGWIYQLAVDFVSGMRAGFLLTAFYGAGIGFAAGYGARLGRCRNPAVAAAIAGICAMGGTLATYEFAYLHHSAAIYASLDREARPASLEEFREGFGMARYIKLRQKVGWRIGPGRAGPGIITGLLVWVVWLIELVSIVVVAVFLGQVPVERPYCEVCGRWAVRRSAGKVDGVDAGELGRAVRADDLGPLLLPRRRQGSRVQARYLVYACPSCAERHLTVRLRRARERGGGEENPGRTVADRAHVTPVQVKLLARHLGDL